MPSIRTSLNLCRLVELIITFMDICSCFLIQATKFYELPHNSVSSNQIFVWTKSKLCAGDKIKTTEQLNLFWKGRTHCGKRRKCLKQAYSTFLAMLQKPSSIGHEN